jgi:hydrogenase maturation factor
MYVLNYCVKCRLRIQDSVFALSVLAGFLVKEGLYVLLHIGSTVNEVGK